ncbi:MAG TPA: UTP--glucose-1-phosphate uridylyltransferase [Clostridia bacterium]|jgi:UTP--glucose-1-phosphate uridylyltransferase|nr:UTP--glucose-1-phosphate uridylyltransferase [Clostridia bacterium]HOK82334.1 UTP--glucose-1-phosphate uridylyltransferase [Clostridia bacterium]HOL61146.1 UTP--glucose-1-phosphate uridylyltransferase [Clostridia bacterium]HPO53720.1 UTP--glucose-1-phosphate uridylyltransferase [Clostridia bacterium]
MKKITKAVIPAAGYGSRFLPVTKAVPKEMLAIVDRPTLHYIVEEAAESGLTDILIIINEGKDAVNNYFGDNPLYERLKSHPNLAELENLLARANITYTYQHVLNGNGAAVQLAKDFAGDEPFVVMFGDDLIYNPQNPCAKQLTEAYYKTGKTILGVQEIPPADAVKYGVVKKGKEEGRFCEVKGIIEKPAIDKLPSTLCSLGRFLLKPNIFDALERAPLKNNELYLTDAIDIIAKEEGVVAYNFEGRRYDIGDKFGFMQANIEYGLRSPYGQKLKAYLENLVGKL